jgi:hypothetical protein
VSTAVASGSLAEIVRACQAAVPELPESAIVASALEAGGPRALTRLAGELASKPDMLVSGCSDASPTAQRLIRGLRALKASIGCSCLGARRAGEP